MRDYSKVSPRAWHGGTFKALRRDSKGLVVALYLLTSPSSNMLGLFSQPVLYMAHETGLGEEGALEGLQRCIEAGFCSFDAESEMVWVHEMAAYQIGEGLKPSDLRCKGIQKDYDGLPDCPFLGQFFDRYAGSFNLTRRRDSTASNAVDNLAPSKPLTKPLTKPLRSQETEQETEQEIHKPLRGKEPNSTVGLRELEAEGVQHQHAVDWLKIRKATLTRTAWDGVKREAVKAGIPIGEAVRIAAERSWRGFNASWLTDRPGQPSARSDDIFAGAR